MYPVEHYDGEVVSTDLFTLWYSPQVLYFLNITVYASRKDRLPSASPSPALAVSAASRDTNTNQSHPAWPSVLRLACFNSLSSGSRGDRCEEIAARHPGYTG